MERLWGESARDEAGAWSLRNLVDELWLQAAVAVLIVAGLACIPRVCTDLLSYWRTQSVGSIGMLAIPCSIILTWRIVREVEWTGSWWGLPMVTAALALGTFAYPTPRLQLSFAGPVPLTAAVPIGVILWLYGCGIVLLFSGSRAWRKAFFPLALLLFVQPVPPFFVTHFDLPLQYFDARIARGFANFLDVQVTGDSLHLLFDHNRLGMMIAPGCDGFSGAIAMGYSTLVASYLYGVRPLARALYAAVAVLLAFALNLARLCALVLFYCAAHAIPALGVYAVGADYIIGGLIFAAGIAAVFSVPRMSLRHEA
ncbi:MAG TPA: exosortase J [Candidatus Binataceae bacterium]|nr:exosortase J [Candidatus Binataceae bacterium]